MNRKKSEGYKYSHGFSLENICSMLACIFGATVLFLAYVDNSQFLVLVPALVCTGLALFSIDLVFTTVSIYGDKRYLYIQPCHPFTFKKKYRFDRSDIKATKVKTDKRLTNYGPVVTHSVILVTKDNCKHVVLIPRHKTEAISVKKELSRWRYTSF